MFFFSVFLLSLFVNVFCDQCIRYEFHETAINQEGNAELLINDCRIKNSKISDYNVVLLSTYGPSMINITFNCCSSLPCRNDLQCPFNFNCNKGKCLVADCNLRDEIEIVEEENADCIIDEDCFFKIPLDKKHWSCINEASECLHKDKCVKKCKRCPFSGDHWSHFSNNSIEVGFHNTANNELLNTNFINDLIPLRNSSTRSLIETSNSSSEFNNFLEVNNNNLNSPETNLDINEFRTEEDIPRLINNDMDNNRTFILNNLVSNNSSNTRKPVISTTTVSPTINITSPSSIIDRNSNISSIANTLVNSSIVPDRFLPSNVTTILDFINKPINSSSRLLSSSNVNNNIFSLLFSNNSTSVNLNNSLSVRNKNDSLVNNSNEILDNLRINLLNNSNENIIFNATTLNTESENFNSLRINRESNITNLSTNRSIIDEKLTNIFSSLISGNLTSTTSNPTIRVMNTTNEVFNQPFNTTSNLTKPLTTPSTLIRNSFNSSTTLKPIDSINSINSNSVFPASILNRSRSNRLNENIRFSARRSSALRSNSARSLLNNHRLIHIPNFRTTTLKPFISNNFIINTNNRNNNNRNTINVNSNNVITNNRNAINTINRYSFNSELLPGIFYAFDTDVDIPRLKPNSTIN